MSNTKCFADLIKVCSVLPALMVMPAMAEVERTVVGAGETYTIKASDNAKLSDNNITGKFDGGLIYVNVGGKLNINGATFANNEFNSDNDSEWGFGNIFNKGEMDIVNAVFMNNFSTSGGAISNSMYASDGKIAGTKFKNNHAWADGGAVSSFGPLSITGSVFEGNTASFLKDESGKYTDVVTGIKNPIGGGAIALGAESETIVASIDSTEFKGNKSGLNGGAIGTRLALEVDEEGNWLDDKDRHRNSAKLNVAATFENNSAERSGGAIYNTFYTDANSSQGKGVIVKGEFENNHAGYHGGAIYNDGDKDTTGNGAIMTVNGAKFEDNIAGDSGGAIYNTGELYVNGGTFEDNIAGVNGGAIYNSGQTDAKDLNMVNVNTIDRRDTAGVLEIKNATFLDNTAVKEGGAIYNAGSMTIIDTDFVGNSVVDGFGGAIKNNGTITVNDTDFYNNVAYSNGAFSTSRSTGDTTIAGGEFVGNHALADGGALGLYLDATVSDVDFKNNVAAKAIILDGKAYDAAADANGGGALFVGQKAKATLTNVHFLENESGVSGGAIVARHNTSVDNGYLTIKSSEFVGNKAGKHGGAIESIYDGVVNIADTTFESNSAKLSGGVIYNGVDINYGNDTGVGLDSTNHGVFNLSGNNTFANNVAGVKGGAIFNDEGGKFTLDGNNTFSGNTANGVANDIHNLGTVTIASGMTSIDGGITGDGILNIEEGATLNMNYASIEQGTINIDGTLMASLLNDKDSVDVTGALSGAGNVLLSAGAAGVYDVSQFTDANLSVDFGKTYQTSIVDGIATLTARQAAEIAADTGASIAAAGAVSGLAASTDAKLQKVSLAMQEALNNEDVAAVEQEVAKVNPNKKPVGQSVSSSVQSQVLSLASGRMSTVGGMTGRAGGDVTGAGVWAQGIVNKSKMGSQFEGRSRGFAMGGDTLIDNVFTLGGGYAYSDTDVLGGGRDIDVESNSIFVYGQYKPAAWYVNATLTYTESEYTDMANIMGEFLDQNYDIKAYGAQAMFGYDFASGVTPEVGLRYLHTTQGEHKNSFGATVKDLDVNFLSGVAGLKYAFAIESDTAVKFSPSMRAAMTYDFLSEDAQATVVFPGAAAYYVDVDSLSRMGGEFGLGLTAEYRGLELSLNYELTLHKDYTSQTGLFKFRYNF